MEEKLTQIENRLAVVETRLAVSDVVGSGIERRLDKIEGTLMWLVRLIIGGMITGFVMFALGGGLAGVTG